MLATGGAGQCFAVTTNPAVSTGDGIAMALRAGVAVADVEFMQFHPTALHHPSMPRPLLSEALRGEGAVLRDEHGAAFMADEHPLGDLAPRDVVARAITRRLVERGLDHLWLDATAIDDFARPLPDDLAVVPQSVGLDPRRDWLPVAPAAHYLCGGVCTDLDGATTLPGLWACGEAACSGVHGANRLASNSLLDGLVFAPRVGRRDRAREGRARRARACCARRARVRATRRRSDRRRRPARSSLDELQRIMTDERRRAARRATSLDDAAARRAAATTRRAGRPPATSCATWSRSAARSSPRPRCAREESRGTHTRLDFPSRRARFLGRFVSGGRRAALRPAPGRRPRAERVNRDLDPPVDRGARGRRAARSPRTSACSATSRRIAVIADDAARRRAGSWPAPRACSRARGRDRDVPPARSRRRGRVAAQRRRRVARRPGARRACRDRCGRSSAASAPR